MVSLNEKRSKIRYVVQNKTDWVEDGNKFGKRMLEKMGWTSGVGLGKNEDGRTEHVDLKFKANLKGVGFVHGKYDDTWVAHSQSFDSVLQQLQQSHPPASTQAESPSSPSSTQLQSLHQTLQQTKRRFTYKKQSSGKDLSSRTNDELDCIFGWNKGNQINQQQAEEKAEQEIEISDNLYQTSTQSINDYFKNKTKEKAQREHQQSSAEESPVIREEEIEPKPKKKKESGDHQKNPYPGSNLLELKGYEGWNIDSSLENILKKKEKQKKRKYL